MKGLLRTNHAIFMNLCVDGSVTFYRAKANRQIQAWGSGLHASVVSEERVEGDKPHCGGPSVPALAAFRCAGSPSLDTANYIWKI